jgi:hypothetical protein
MLSPSKRQTSHKFDTKALVLAVGGGAAFWATTVATSLLPIAADYRAAGSNWSIKSAWAGSLVAGLILGACVSYAFLRLFDRIPTLDPVLKAAFLGFIALVVASIVIDVPRCFLLPEPGAAPRYFLTGVLLNAPRFLLLGASIGALFKKLYGEPTFDLTRG